MNLKEKAKTLKLNIPTVFLVLKDKNTPVLAKVTAAITIAYVLSPIDFIPDFIPVLGYLDDIILLPALIALTMKLIPKEIWEQNRMLAANMWKDGIPKKWYYAVPIIILWLFLFWIIVKAIWL